MGWLCRCSALCFYRREMDWGWLIHLHIHVYTTTCLIIEREQLSVYNTRDSLVICSPGLKLEAHVHPMSVKGPGWKILCLHSPVVRSLLSQCLQLPCFPLCLSLQEPHPSTPTLSFSCSQGVSRIVNTILYSRAHDVASLVLFDPTIWCISLSTLFQYIYPSLFK